MNQPSSPPAWQTRCQEYIGRSETCHDVMAPFASNALLATFNDSPTLTAGDSVPPLFHWLYCNPSPQQRQLKGDGHEQLGRFLPPMQYSHRMWAGSRIEFHEPLRLGTVATRVSYIDSVEFKAGSSGPLGFVHIRHCYMQNDRLCLSDVQTLVYRDSPKIPHTSVAPTARSPQSLDAVSLFRYSALTFNSHRIHYDLDYCREVEHYPHLVVHGPLMATLLQRHLQKAPPARLSHFRFRGLAPVFAGEGFRLHTDAADPNHATLIKADDTPAVSASVSWA